ncbi:MAG: MBL fold metallo-hydrolase [Thermoleophilia bacterium]|nr:MBL fold metallo-hydrolase [Thermoleophilia bacterium]
MSSVTVTDLGGGVHRVTHPLPWALNHIHCYAVASSDGWALIDAGLATPAAESLWREALAQLGRPRIRTVFISHYHPDHITGGAGLVALVDPDEVLEGAYDAVLAARVYTDPDDLATLEDYLLASGMPPELAADSVEDEGTYVVPPAEPTRLLEEGDTVELGDEAFRVLHLPGHADGHVVLLGERTGRMFGGDVLLHGITPNVGLWQDTLPDPLGRYLETLRRIQELAPSVVYPGHRRVIEDAPGRAAEIVEHHAIRLDEHEAALRRGAATPYECVLGVWGDDLGLHERRFALVESLSHLARLAALGRAVEREPGRWQAV